MPSLKTLNKSWFILTIIAYIVALLLYGFWNNDYQKKEILKNVDTTLYNTAISLKYMLPDDFHDRAIDAQSVSIDEDKYIANKLTSLVKETGFKYVYTIIKKEDKLFFVAGDLTANPENERGTFYYYEYEGADESFINAFKNETPTYKTVSDQWGTVRTVMVPEKSPGGINYLACADCDIDYVKDLLYKNLLKSIATILFFLLLTMPIIKVYANSYKEFLKNIKKSEKKYRTILESMKDAAYITSRDCRIEYMNPRMISSIGRDATGEICYKTVFNLDEKCPWCVLDQTQEGEHAEYEFKNPQDNRYYAVSNSPIYYFEELISKLTIFRDITDIKKKEFQLRQAQKIAKLGYFVFDIRKDSWRSSGQLDDIFGIDKNLKKNTISWLQMVHPDHRKTMSVYFKKNILTQHQNFDKEYKIINKKTEQEKWVHGLGKFKFDKNNNPVEVFGTIQDITKRKQMERKLLDSQQNLASVLNNTQDAVVRLDENFRHVFGNSALYEATGLSVEQYIGKTNEEIGFPEESCSFWQKKHESVFQNKKSEIFEFKFLTVNKGERIFQAIVNPEFDENKDVKSIISFMRDITESKRTEMALMENQQRLQQIEKAESLSLMAGAIAHNFNNQLSVVMGNLELALEDLPNDAKVHEFLNEAMKATQRSSEISGLMLTYLGQGIIKLEALNFSEACHHVLPFLHDIIPKNITLETNLMAPGTVVVANTNQIQTVLTHLISNSVEAISNRKGDITLEIKTIPASDIPKIHIVPIDWQPDADIFVCLVVKDTGCGISDEDIDKIFDPFFTTKFTGRGLGLPVVLGIVKTWKGAVSAESRKGHGSIFRIFLPLSTNESP